MGNEVEIVVKAKDKTDFGGITRQMKGHFSKAGDDSGKSFGSSVRKWFTGDGTKLLGQGGQIGGEAFKSGLMGVLKTPVVGPVVAAGLAAALATVMPAVGAVAAGGIIAGFGAGLAGLGIVFAAKSDAVKTAWSSMLSGMGAQMQLISKPFESVLVNIAGYVHNTFDAFVPYLSSAFSKMAGSVQNFAKTASAALTGGGLTTAIGPIADAFNAVLDSLGPGLTGAISQVSDGLVKLSTSVSNGPDALRDLAKGFGDIVNSGLGVITALNDANTAIQKLTGTSAVSMIMGFFASTLDIMTASVRIATGPLTLLNTLLGKTGKSSDADALNSMSDAARLVAENAGKIPPPMTAAQAAIEATKKVAADGKQAFEEYISSMFRLQNLSLGLSGAQINLQSAIDNATKSIKDNGRNVDINTEKGRANKTALDAVAQSANAQTEAMQRAGKGNAASGAAAEASRANFVKLAQQMGYSKTAANHMADSMIAIPNVLREAKLVADKRDLDTKLAAATKALADPNLTATKRAKLEATIAQLLKAKGQAQAAIDALHGKTVTVTMKLNSANVQQKVNNQLSRAGAGQAHGGGIRGYAGGGNPRPGRFLVGEEGPEFLDLSGGVGRVTPASNTRQQLAQGGGRQAQIVLEFKSNGGRMEDAFVEIMRKFVKVSYGGNVQAAFGS